MREKVVGRVLSKSIKSSDDPDGGDDEMQGFSEGGTYVASTRISPARGFVGRRKDAREKDASTGVLLSPSSVGEPASNLLVPSTSPYNAGA